RTARGARAARDRRAHLALRARPPAARLRDARRGPLRGRRGAALRRRRGHAGAGARSARRLRRRRLRAPRPPGDWAAALGALLEEFFAPEADEDEAALAAVRAALGALADSASRAGFTAPVSLALVRAELGRALEVPTRTGRFLAGSVTVCAMVPMRSIPFAVVCLLGMNDDAFPRANRAPSFDRMAEAPRRGDRNRRDDDRYL